MPSKYVVNDGVSHDREHQESDEKEVQLTLTNGIAEKPYPGMTVEDLDRFSNTPFWSLLRRISLIVCFLIWLTLLVSSIAFVLIYKRCEPVPSQKWWKTASVYQIFVPSFQDSNGDGLGDLKGIVQRLDELKYLGVDTLILSSIYEQPANNDHSIVNSMVTNATKIDPRFGELSDMETLVSAAKSSNMRVVLELPVNHVSWNHSWFRDSELKKPGYENAFVWTSKNCSQTSSPNNWRSASGYSTWTYSQVRRECYYHRFCKMRPDLNWRSAVIQQQMKNIIEFWLGFDVDGFLFTSAIYLFEDFDLRDEPKASTTPTRTQDLPETVDIIMRLRAFVHNISEEAVVFVEAGEDQSRLDRYIKFGRTAVADLAISRLPIKVLNSNCSVECFWSMINTVKGTSNILLGDRKATQRLARRYPSIKTATLIYGMSPGALITLYGDEIGLTGSSNGSTSVSNALTPMLWNNGTNGGFSDGRPWQPVSLSPAMNFMAQKGVSTSNLEFFRGIMSLRKENGALRFGKTSAVGVEGQILSFLRHYDGYDSFLLVANVGRDDQKNIKFLEDFSASATLVGDTETGNVNSEGPSVKLDGISLKANEAKLFKLRYEIKEQL